MCVRIDVLTAKRTIAIALVAALVLLTACQTSGEARPVDALYVNAVVWTGEGGGDRSLVAVADGDIAFVGSDADRARFRAGTTIDLAGRFLMPGFIDNHVHFLDGGMALASVDLRDAATPAEFRRRIADYARDLAPGRWVLNGNWDHQRWGGELPERSWIDADTGSVPVFVHRSDGHMALANSAALALAGIDAATPDPPGGEIVRDADGVPTGVLKDAAMAPVVAALPAPTDEELLQAFETAQAHALSLGLTEVHSVTASPDDVHMLRSLELASASDAMRLRVYAFTPLQRWRNASAKQRDRLRLGGVKGFVDGSLGSATAWFHESLTDQPGNYGFPLVEPDALAADMRAADAAGLQLAVHAIGDRAIDVLIEAMKAIAGSDIRKRRYRIEHFQHPSRDAIAALASAGIIASMQPYHAIDDGRWAEKRIGAERAKTTYAFRSLLDAGAILTFGSDWPVAPLSPLEGVYAAVTRRTTDGAYPDGWQPQEKISVEEALRAYTAANAYATFQDDRAGTLAAGKRADFVVLSEDPRAVDPRRIRDIEVLRTVIEGETVYERPPTDVR